ncbi:MAG: TlpA family protein disulfide reductase [Prevotella sp.]|nr:TlpA family protein disulfide reductase [Prevotella sp.]
MMVCGQTIQAQETQEDLDAQYATALLKPGTEAPQFIISGKDSCCNIPLSQFRGQYVVLDFWASWCPDCRKDIPEVKAMYDRFGSMNVQFIGISFDTDKAAWQNCIEKNEMKWLQHSELKKWKKQTKIDQDYHINWIPSYYLIDTEGKVVLGTVQHEKIAAKLAELEAKGDLKAYTANSNCCAGKTHCLPSGKQD